MLPWQMSDVEQGVLIIIEGIVIVFNCEMLPERGIGRSIVRLFHAGLHIIIIIVLPD